jgi:DNA primase
MRALKDQPFSRMLPRGARDLAPSEPPAVISPNTIAQIRDRTDIVALIGESIRLVRRGRSFLGLCPFHKEKSPSFSVSAERGFFYCFGCKENGSAIDFVMKLEGKSFPDAVRALAERAGIEIEETSTDAERREANAARKSKDDLYAVNGLAATFFEHCLRGGPGARPHALAHHAAGELARRGMPLPPSGDTSPALETVQAFRIGYAPYAWDGLTAYLQKHGISPAQAERVGLIVPRSSGGGHYDRFRHRLMFAVIDVSGRVIAFSGRSLPEPAEDELAAIGLRPSNKTDDKPAKYINSPESPIYTKGEHLFGLYQARQAIRQKGDAVLVEGNFDVVSLHARGIQNVVAPLGTAFTEQQAKLVKRFAPSVTIVFDGDTAGKKATWAARIPCRTAGLTARAADVPKGMDPDELAQKKGPAALDALIKNSLPLKQYLLEKLLKHDELQGAEIKDQMARIKAAVSLIGEEEDPVERGLTKAYADQLSSSMIVSGQSPTDLHSLERIIAANAAQKPALPLRSQEARGGHERARSRPRGEDIPLEILACLLDFPELLDDPELEPVLGLLDGPVALAVAAMRQSLGPKGAPDVGEFLARCPALIHPFAARRLAGPVFETVAEAKDELVQNGQKLQRLLLKNDNAAIREELRRLDMLGDWASEEAKLREIQQRALRRHNLG